MTMTAIASAAGLSGWSLPRRGGSSDWTAPLKRPDPLIARSLAHLRALQVGFRAESTNYAIEIWDTLGGILDSHFPALALSD